MWKSLLYRSAGPSAIMGGVLWMVYGIFLMLEPWGVAELYREDLGYQLVTRPALFALYTMPGSLALALTALALLGMRSRGGDFESRATKLRIFLSYLTLGLAMLSLFGTLTLIAPLSFASRTLGTLALGGATFVMGMTWSRTEQGTQRALRLLGSLGFFLLPLQPLVWAWQVVPESMGAGIIALFGAGWLLLGSRSRLAASQFPALSGQ